jgi:GNAT superfamily N-acetyltransferase
VADGADLARSARTLLGGYTLTWAADGEPADGPRGTTLRLRDPEGGVLTVTRPGADFTPAEYARVHAPLALDAAFARWLRGRHSVLLLVTGEELTVRQASVADVPAMHDRCGARTRRPRYPSGGTRPTAADLTRLVSRRHGRTLVVELAAGELVAMGDLMRAVPRDGADEVALLVADDWQRRGIGTVLPRRLLATAPECRRTVAVTGHDDGPMPAVPARAGGELVHAEPGVAHLTPP